MAPLVAEFPGSGFLAAAVIGSGIAAQIIGGIAGVAIIRALYPGVTPAEAADIIVPHHRSAAEPALVRAADDGASPVAGRSAGPGRPV